ncbi:MAG: hypothetical protein ACK5JT_19445 [Hyphomicrobiaceae bacterium]
MKRPQQHQDDFRIVVDLAHAEREAERISTLLHALRKRHDLSRFEFTQLVCIRPAGPTHSHPMLTLGTRFAETEDMLLSTYLHEQMHWYLWQYGGHDYDPIEPFFDDLVSRYPKAPIKLPDGARSYEQTYLHLVVCWLEVWATAEIIGMARAREIAGGPWGYRWIYRTVLDDWDWLQALLETHGLFPLRPLAEVVAMNGTAQPERGARAAPAAGRVNGGPRKRTAAKPPPPSRKSRRTPRGRGGRLAG